MLEAFLRTAGEGLEQGDFMAFGVALAAGIVASAVCPCTLPMGIGIASVSGAAEGQCRRSGFSIALAFFVGVVVSLTTLGALAGRLGAILTESFGRYWTLGMALVSLTSAVLAFWRPRVSMQRLSALRRPGLAGAFGYGFIFSVGTSAAPLLLLLTAAAAQARPTAGMILAFAFGLGRGLPFLLAGAFAGLVTHFARLGTWQQALQLVSGGTLLFVSFYYMRAFLALL